MGFKVSADTGGTFIDVVVQDAGSEQVIGKSLTTHDRVFTGLARALDAAASNLGLTAAQVLDDTDLFIYGTTRATNAIITRNVARTALLTTEGFEDVLLLKEGGKQDGYDFTRQYPEPTYREAAPLVCGSGSIPRVRLSSTWTRTSWPGS